MQHSDKLREAAQQALDWFEWLHSGQPDHMAGIDTDGVRRSLRAALVEPQHEPVAWMDEFGNVFPLGAQRGPKYLNEPMKPLYTAPQPAKREPLTDEALLRQALEALEAVSDYQADMGHHRAAVAALRERLGE